MKPARSRIARAAWCCLALGSAILLAGCAAGTTPAASVKDAQGVRGEQTARMLAAVLAQGRDGDWMVVRGYKPTDDLVAGLTNAPVSHVGVLDLGRREVIEADAKGVHATELETFIDRSHRLVLVRPIWSDVGHAAAMAKARGLVGRPYDFLGLVGVDVPGNYYCSELAVRVYAKFQRREHEIPRVIEPAHLYFWGTVLYDSRPRHWGQ